MLTEIRLKNFKAFADLEQTAPMSRITLIYGPNSGGKSSIIQAILMLKQSALEAGSAATIWGLVTRGEYIDLGSYVALLHNHDAERQLGVGLTFVHRNSRISAHMSFVAVSDIDERGEEYLEDSAMLSEVTYQMADRGNVLTEARLDSGGGSWWNAQVSVGGISATHMILDFGRELRFLPELKLLELERLLEKKQKQLPERESGLVRERARLRRLEQNQERRQFEDLYSMSEEQLQRLPPLDRDLGRARATMRALNRRPDQNLLQALEQSLTLEQLLELKNIPISFIEQMQATRYLGPLRSYPERLYKVPGVNSYFSGLRGEFTHHRLYYQPGLIHKVNGWFSRFKIPYELDVRKVGDMAVSGEHIALVLVDRRSKTPVTLADVGFGINQVLPVIVEGADFFIPGEGRVLCVEQPEIHLHPRLQANLADLMIDTIRGEGEKQWIVETHSELIILRIQRRIREGKLDPSDVSVLYVDPSLDGTEGSSIIQLRLDENGDFIDYWPNGFFEEGFGELMAQEEEEC